MLLMVLHHSNTTLVLASVCILGLSNTTLQIMGYVLIVRYEISYRLAHK